jgi:hypothetical protein
MTSHSNRILALVLGQAAVLLVLCWSSLFRSYTTVDGYWTFLLAVGFAFYFLSIGRLLKGTPWN